MTAKREGGFAWVKEDGKHPCAVMVGEDGIIDARPVAVACSIANQINTAHAKACAEAVEEMRKRAEHAEGQLAATYIELGRMEEALRRKVAEEAGR